MSVPNNYTAKWLSGNLLATEVNKTKVKMNKLVYLDLPVLEISKTLMYEFQQDYTKPKYCEKENPRYMDRIALQ